MQNSYTWNPIDPKRIVLIVGRSSWYCMNLDWAGGPLLGLAHRRDLGALVDLSMVPRLAPEEVPESPAGAGKKWRADGFPKRRRFGGR